MEIEHNGSFENLRKEVLDAIESVSKQIASSPPFHQQLDRQQQREEQLHQFKEANASKEFETIPSLANLSATMVNLSEMGKRIQLEQKLLQSLDFQGRVYRYKKTKSTHATTFQWMLQSSQETDRAPIRFTEWLREKSGVFWIEGKAGSGKSTLMKFLCNNPTTMSHLRTWAQDKRLFVAHFFLWNAGSRLQKSREGLLRSIIFEILRRCPDLLDGIIYKVGIPAYFEQEECWDEEDLLRIYRIIMSKGMPIRFCFFIDGLDEYEDEKRGHEELLDTLRSMEYSSDTKLCVSSRPWIVFRDEFSKSPEWHIKLEDLTRSDIRSLVTSEVNRNAQFRILRDRDSRYPDLVEEVVNRARGVFLWVILVIKDLCHGLTHHDPVDTLLKRLERIPEGLDGFFQHMIDSIPPIYRAESTRTFKTALLLGKPENFLIYSFIDEMEENPNCCLNLPSKKMPLEEREARRDQLQRRLHARCQGLLEIHGGSIEHEKVDFLHRTVRDFLLQSGMVQNNFLGSEISDHAISRMITHSWLGYLKTSDYNDEHAGWGTFKEDIQSLTLHAQKATTGDIILRDIADVIKGAKSIRNVLKEVIVGNQRGIRETDVDKVMVLWAVKNSFIQYLRTDLIDYKTLFNDVRKRGESLLVTTLDYSTRWDGIQIKEIIQILLEHGADPNQFSSTSSTVSLEFIEGFISTLDDGNSSGDEFFEILSLLVTYGARLPSTSDGHSKGRYHAQNLKKYLSTAQVTRLYDQEKAVSAEQAKQKKTNSKLRRILRFKRLLKNRITRLLY